LRPFRACSGPRPATFRSRASPSPTWRPKKSSARGSVRFPKDAGSSPT
jgi:hypothetical protein